MCTILAQNRQRGWQNFEHVILKWIQVQSLFNRQMELFYKPKIEYGKVLRVEALASYQPGDWFSQGF